MRGSSKWLIATWIVALASAAPLRADVFTLNDGRKIDGKVKRETATSYFVESALGEVEIKKSDVKARVVGKSARETFEERFAAAKTAAEFFEAGNYADAEKLKSHATKAWKRAVELETQHEGANKALGHVLYKGAWMPPDERDRRAKLDEEAEMLEKGFVRFKDRWVTPDEKSKLEQGLILRDGRWMSEADSKRLDGLEEYDGQWFPRTEAMARADVGAVAKLLGRPVRVICNAQASIAGDYGEDVLTRIGTHVVSAREWFDASFKVEPGLKLLGGRLAEFYVWNRDSQPYQDSVAHFAELTTTVPEGWAGIVRDRHGFFWIDPYAVSSARVWNRPDEDLVGHCVHHWGHMLLGRLGYDGRLLPPWYDEGFASLTEFRTFKRNAVFCRSASTVLGTGGTTAKKAAAAFNFDAGLFREGAWQDTLKKALAAKVVPSFERLASLDIGQLELLDIACGMAITWWLEAHSPEALPKFHAALRKSQPRAPERLISLARDRHAQYEAAFQVAVALSTRDADQAWRAWFQAR